MTPSFQTKLQPFETIQQVRSVVTHVACIRENLRRNKGCHDWSLRALSFVLPFNVFPFHLSIPHSLWRYLKVHPYCLQTKNVPKLIYFLNHAFKVYKIVSNQINGLTLLRFSHRWDLAILSGFFFSCCFHLLSYFFFHLCVDPIFFFEVFFLNDSFIHDLYCVEVHKVKA